MAGQVQGPGQGAQGCREQAEDCHGAVHRHERPVSLIANCYIAVIISVLFI